MMMAPPPQPRPPEGLYFALHDLQAAMAWAHARPTVGLSMMIDHSYVPEVIQVCPPGSDAVRWCLWRDHTGRLRVDDWLAGEFDLPYSSLMHALSFIASKLKVGLHPQG